jgi:formate dehydrogenase subunit delta
MSHDQAGHDEMQVAQGIAKIVRMANQIGTFFESKEDHAEGVAGVAEHINKFWEPRMRRHFFEVFDAGGDGLKPIVMEAAAQVRRPAEPPSDSANAGAPGGKGPAQGESTAEIAASQG